MKTHLSRSVSNKFLIRALENLHELIIHIDGKLEVHENRRSWGASIVDDAHWVQVAIGNCGHLAGCAKDNRGCEKRNVLDDPRRATRYRRRIVWLTDIDPVSHVYRDHRL